MFALRNRSSAAAAKSRRRATLEPLERRQMYSAGTAAIAAEYAATANECDVYGTPVSALLGAATSGVVAVPGVGGAMMQTYHDNGAIYWSAATGAHTVVGSIGAEYAATANEVDASGHPVQLVLGLPTADEQAAAGTTGGRVSNFQGGQIYWSSPTGAHAVIGSIYNEYAADGGSTGPLGLPTADAQAAVGTNGGQVSNFQYGQVYWSPATGAHALTGAIYNEYNAVGGSTSPLGLPTADAQAAVDTNGGQVSTFQNGQVYWSPATGAHAVAGAIYTEYAAMGGSASYLGLPTVDESGPASDRTVVFQGGTIAATPTGVWAQQTAVTVATRYGAELVVTAAGPRDSVTVSQTGSTVLVYADGQSFSAAVPADGLFVYTRGGTDTLSIFSTVTVRTTVDAIDAAPTSVYTDGTNVSVWDDSTDHVYGSASVHAVAAFAGGVSKAVGVSLPNPAGQQGSYAAVSASLFGGGPAVTDANQGAVGDCYLMAALSGLAEQQPARLEGMVADLGDGTYAVEFVTNGTPEFVRVSDQLPLAGSAYVYASPGLGGTIWGPVIEKAFCYAKPPTPGLTDNTYGNINGGNAPELYALMGIGKRSIRPSQTDDLTLGARLASDLHDGQVVTFATTGTCTGLVAGHVYTVLDVAPVLSPTGAVLGWEYLVRNPWGYQGSSVENSVGLAMLTFGQLQANVDVFDETTI